MGVGLVLHRRVGMDDEGNIIDMDAAGRDVGGDEGCRGAACECREVAFACILGQVAVQLDGTDSDGVELASELLCAVLRAREDDHPALAGHSSDLFDAIGFLDDDDAMLEEHRCFDSGCMRYGVGEVAGDEGIDAASEGCREQQSLTVLGCVIEDSLHHGQEALISHVISLIKNAHLDSVERDIAGLHVVQEASGTSNDNLNTRGESLALGCVGHPTKDGCGLHPVGGRQRLDDGCNLRGKFASRDEHERPWTPAHRCHRIRCEASHNGQRECKGLARAGAPLPEDIATGE